MSRYHIQGHHTPFPLRLHPILIPSHQINLAVGDYFTSEISVQEFTRTKTWALVLIRDVQYWFKCQQFAIPPFAHHPHSPRGRSYPSYIFVILHLHNGIPWSSPSDPRRSDGLCHCRLSIGECASAHVILFRCSSLTPESLPTCISNDTSHRQKNTLFRYSSASQLSCRSSTHMWGGPLHLLGKLSERSESISPRFSDQLRPIAFPHSIPWPGIRGRSSPNYPNCGWYILFSVLSTDTDRYIHRSTSAQLGNSTNTMHICTRNTEISCALVNHFPP